METFALHEDAPRRTRHRGAPIGFVVTMMIASLASIAGRAHAQVASDAFLRAWLDTTFYSGHKTTLFAPVLQADIKVLRQVRVGLDLPFVSTSTTVSASVPGSLVAPVSVSASQFTLGSPTLHGVLEIESGPLFASAGLGVALSVRNTDLTSVDDLASLLGMQLANATRGVWNPWWYNDGHTVFAPGEVSYRGQNYAFGVEGALMLLLSRKESDAEQTALQIGPYLAAITGKTSTIGIRWRNVITFNRGPLLGGDHAQSSLEAYAEARVVKLLLLGGGFLLNLDKPFGVFGSGSADIWAVRLKAGVAL